MPVTLETDERLYSTLLRLNFIHIAYLLIPMRGSIINCRLIANKELEVTQGLSQPTGSYSPTLTDLLLM
ncbi:hypothetical protein P8452_42609 [Trifolium repens]|nr:hypothetical protein P8452_42609 [Trifolium repens]